MRERKHSRAAPIWRCLALCTLQVLLVACGSGDATPTLNPTQIAEQAATVIAGLPTAESLTPRPSLTPVPTITPVVTSPPTAALEPTTVPEPTATAAPVSEYTVKAGDTLMSIAIAHKTSMAAIMLLNNMGETQIVRLNQVLRLPTAPMWEGENLMWVIYNVRVGDTVGGIARTFSVRADDLVRVNQLPDASAIRVGQTLVIPTTSLVAPPAQPTARPAVVAPPPTAFAVVEAAPAADAPPAQAAPASLEIAVHTAGTEAMRAALLFLYNQARIAAGVPPLLENVALTMAAQLHAQDSVQRGYGSHVGSDGSRSSQRVARAGYTGRITGENWAWGRSVEQAFDMWFHQEAPSGPHYDNILSPRYTEVGFGIAASPGGYYFIANLGAP